LTPGNRVKVEMDGERSRIYFSQEATVLDPMNAPGGSLLVLRLDKAIVLWDPLPKRVRFIGVGVSAGTTKTLEGSSGHVPGTAIAEVYAIQHLDPDKPDRRWPHIPRRLQPRHL